MLTLVVALLLMSPDSRVFENDYVSVHKNAAPCADAARKCGDRIIVALADVQMKGKKMKRGEVSVFQAAESYAAPAGGDFLEVAIKPSHPPVKGPSVQIPPEKNSILYDGEKFFIFEEKLEPGDTRERHGHAQRLVVVINETSLQQWPDGRPALTKNQVPNDVHFNEPVVHVAKNTGSKPLRNIVIELKP